MKYADFKALGLSGGTWWAYVCPGMACPARKRLRVAVYAVRADLRWALDIYLVNCLRKRHTEVSKMTLENAYRPWWMSFNQYQAMLTRLGLPF